MYNFFSVHFQLFGTLGSAHFLMFLSILLYGSYSPIPTDKPFLCSSVFEAYSDILSSTFLTENKKLSMGVKKEHEG